MEIWKQVRNYEGMYQVSNLGRVKSMKRTKQNHGSLQEIPERILSIAYKSNGYALVNLWRNNKSSNRHVHRLVAEAFLDNYSTKLQVNHIDMDKKNNAVVNLEMVTNKVNHLKAHRFKGKKRGAYKHYSGFRAVIQIENKTHHLGTFKTKEEAHDAYYNFYSTHYGEAPW